MDLKELWVKKTIWRRYLIKGAMAGVIDAGLIEDKNGIETVEEVYNENNSVEYDNEELFIPVQFEIKDIDPVLSTPHAVNGDEKTAGENEVIDYLYRLTNTIHEDPNIHNNEYMKMVAKIESVVLFIRKYKPKPPTGE